MLYRFSRPGTVLLVALAVVTAGAVPANAKKSKKPQAPESGTVIEVLKGDEIRLASGVVVRLTGIDVPTADFSQRVGDYYGRQALESVAKWTKDDTLTIKYGRATHDSRGRALGYVYLSDGTFLNQRLVQDGLAIAACFPPNGEFCDTFTADQKQAMANEKGLWAFDFAIELREQQKAKVQAQGSVAEVLDGDEIKLHSGKVIRLIGIDAPESEASKEGGHGSSSYLGISDLLAGQQVRIEYDSRLQDPRGRYLAYLFVQQEGKEIHVNAELLRRDAAWLAVFPPNIKKLPELKEAQQAGIAAGAGIWAP